MSAARSTRWAAIKDAAQRLGFHVFRLNILVYGYMGFVAGIASLVQAQLAQSVTPTVLVGKELDVLAAVVLGGASLTGGVGTVFGTILGVALLAILQNGLVLLGVSSYWNQLFVGLSFLSRCRSPPGRSAAPRGEGDRGMSGDEPRHSRVRRQRAAPLRRGGACRCCRSLLVAWSSSSRCCSANGSSASARFSRWPSSCRSSASSRWR